MDSVQTKLPAVPRLADRLEASGAALLFAALGLLPIDWASALGGAIGRRIGPSLGISKRARINLRRALPQLSEAAIEEIVAGMWDNLGRVAAEYPHLREIRVFAPDGRVETRGLDYMDRAVAAGRRMIIFSGHIANWEIAALAAAQYGITVTQIYRAPNNPIVDRLIARFRGDLGEYIPKGARAARRAFAALYRGEHLTMLADQKLNEGIPVPFFGRPAMTATALALLALRFDCDVLPARIERLRGALPHYGFPTLAAAANRRPGCRRRGADHRRYRGIGVVDSRSAGGMALGPPALAGLARGRPVSPEPDASFAIA